ncbi:MAG: phosphoribosylanthranilate isomerase [Bacteroidota bacterium]
MKLKICGITTLEDARYCAAAGADYLGFIQYPESPRFIETKKAGGIIDWLFGSKPVGVFVNASVEEINDAVDAAGFEYAQLHGDETAWECSQIQVPVIKAFRVRAGTSADDLREQLDEYGPYVDRFLLDAFSTNAYGGTGEVFNWAVAQELAADGYEFFLAGGIGPHNVRTAAETVQPYGIDASSRLESSPGVKDFDKLADFFEAFDAVRESTA